MGDSPARQSFTAELEQLRLQVEVMGVRVDENICVARAFLADGDPIHIAQALAADDDIDAMNVSLTERCYELLAREAPVASDLRFVLSVTRVLGELERVGDLALRIVKIGDGWALLNEHPAVLGQLRSMADTATDAFRAAMAAWSSADLDRARAVAGSGNALQERNAELVASLVRLEGPDAVATALPGMVVGRALDRIVDHAAIIGSRLRYLLTGDPRHLAAEIR